MRKVLSIVCGLSAVFCEGVVYGHITEAWDLSTLAICATIPYVTVLTVCLFINGMSAANVVSELINCYVKKDYEI